MKYVLVFLLVFSSSLVYVQPPFTGVIEYKITGLPFIREDADHSLLTAYFGQQAIRLVVRENKKSDREEILILLDSAKMYILNMEEMKYSIRKLVSTPVNKSKPQPRIIQGYKTSPLNVGYESAHAIMLTEGLSELTIYPADDLYFPIPDSLRFNPELILVYKDRIILAVEGKIKLHDAYDDDSPSVATIKAEAISVKPQRLDPSVFKIPDDFTFIDDNWMMELDTTPYSYDSAWIDSTGSFYVDTSAVSSPVIEEQPVQQPAKPSNKKTGKQQSPARKPD